MKSTRRLRLLADTCCILLACVCALVVSTAVIVPLREDPALATSVLYFLLSGISSAGFTRMFGRLADRIFFGGES